LRESDQRLMARNTFIGGTDGGFEVVDVNGSFARFLRQAPRIARRRIGSAVLSSAVRLTRGIAAEAPVGPEAPHLARTVTFKHRGLTAHVGYLAEDFGGDEAGDNQKDWKGLAITNALVAMFNEYGVAHHGKKPNPFMRHAAERESSAFVKDVKEAIADMEKHLGGGFGGGFNGGLGR
jgi:hypothetical protein